MLAKMEEPLKRILSDKETTFLDIGTLSNFGQRVVYAQVKPRNTDTWEVLLDTVRNAVTHAGPAVKSTNSFEFVPHVTVAKVSGPVARLRHSKYIPTAHY